jgi:molecular chaperone GrpE
MELIAAIGWILALAACVGAATLWTQLEAARAQQNAQAQQLQVQQRASQQAIEEREATLTRVRRQAEDDRRFAAEQVIAALMPALDDFDRALDTLESGPLAQGVRLIHATLSQALARHGLERYDAQGQPFDPVLHEAIDTAAAPGVAPGVVLKEHGRGYRLNGRVIRPAKVVVSTEAPAAATPPDAAAADAEPTIELLWEAPRAAGEMTLDELVLAAQARHGADGSALTWPPEE